MVTDARTVSIEAQWGYKFTLLPSSAFEETLTTVSGDGDNNEVAVSLEREGQYVQGLVDRALTMLSTLSLINFAPYLAPIDPWQSLQKAKRLGGELEAYFGGLINLRRTELRERRELGNGPDGATASNQKPPRVQLHDAAAENGRPSAGDDQSYDAGMEAVRKFLRSTVAPEKSTFLDMLLSLEGEEGITDEEMYLLLFDMVSGGSDTTSKTVEWAICELMVNPEAMAKLREELKGFYEGRSDVNDVVKLPYLQVRRQGHGNDMACNTVTEQC